MLFTGRAFDVDALRRRLTVEAYESDSNGVIASEVIEVRVSESTSSDERNPWYPPETRAVVVAASPKGWPRERELVFRIAGAITNVDRPDARSHYLSVRTSGAPEFTFPACSTVSEAASERSCELDDELRLTNDGYANWKSIPVVEMRPRPPGFTVEVEGPTIRIAGEFESDITYELVVGRGTVDDIGRKLEAARVERIRFQPPEPELRLVHDGHVIIPGRPASVGVEGFGVSRARVEVTPIPPERLANARDLDSDICEMELPWVQLDSEQPKSAAECLLWPLIAPLRAADAPFGTINAENIKLNWH